ncbi:MAG: ABC transporter ATP-binding protein, partial [Pseudomonadota bacterium]
CIIALHDINLALRFCDLIAVLKDGQQVAAGIPEDVIQPGLIEDVYAVAVRVERCSAGTPFVLADKTAS